MLSLQSGASRYSQSVIALCINAFTKLARLETKEVRIQCDSR
jgi:hypothetical protein